MPTPEASLASHDEAGLVAEGLNRIRHASRRDGDCTASLPGGAIRRFLLPFLIATLFSAAEMCGAPANDNIAKSASIGSGGGTVTGSNVDASKQSGEPAHGGNPGGKSVWWTWTAPGSSSVTISTAGSDFDTLLGVYTGPSAGNLVTVGSSDDVGVLVTSALAFAAVSGTTYRIAVDGWADPDGGIADSGNISLSVTPGGVRPANDDFASAATINAAGGTVTGSNVNATRQGGEPVFAGNSGMRSVWWVWTPTQSGNALIETANSSFDTILGIFTGSSLNALTLVGENDDAAGQSTSSVVIPVTAGTAYRIAVDGWGGETGSVSLSVQHTDSTPPGNDDFANSFTLPDSGGASSGTNINATKQTGEPNHAGDTGGRSVWWRWTAPGDGTAVISTAGSSFDTILGVYTGTTVATLTEVESSDDDGELTTSRAEFVVVSGTTYRIAVDGWGAAVGSVAISAQFTAGAAPANDDFANALALPAGGGSTTGSTVGASKQAGEPAHAGDAGGHSVWWHWTAPADGVARINTAGSSFNTLLAVYLGGSVNTLEEVTSSDDDGDIVTSRVEFDAVSGTTYRIAVDGAGGVFGNVRVAVQFIPDTAPANDAFASAIALFNAGGATTGTNVDATKEPGEPDHAGNSGGRSVWWIWTAPGNGTAGISTAGSNFDTLLGVYTGADVGSLTEVAASNDDGGLVTSRVEFAATSGTTYRIAVDGWGGAAGNVSLLVQFTVNNPPANDAFADAIVFAPEGGNDLGTNADATKEAGEPVHADNAGGRSVWWRWTPSLTGTATISTAGSSFDTLLGVYTGAGVDALTLVASDDDHGGASTSVVEFNAASGTTYWIAVDGFNDEGAIASGQISLAIVNSVPPAAPVASAATAVTTSGFTANWSTAGGATGYRLDVSTSNTFASFVAGYQNLDLGNATSTLVSGLSASTTYYYRIRAYNGSGTSANSATITVATSAAPPPPPAAPAASAATSVTASGFTANWSTASGATGYRLDVSTSITFANYVSGYQGLDVGNVTNRAVSGLSAGTTYYYRIRAYNGSGTSADSATINVTTSSTTPTPTAPSIATQPTIQTVVIGGDATFTVTAAGTAPLSYQWKRDGENVSGATNSTLTVLDVQPGGGGTYTVVVTNDAGSVTSSPATLALDTTPRLINVSCRAAAGSGASTLIMGFYISGTGTKTLLIRGVGQRLSQSPFNLSNTVADPKVRVYDNNQNLVGTNDDWNSALAPDFLRMGAFNLVDGSKDAAMKIDLVAGNLYTVHLVNDGPLAEALIEVYDFSRDLGTRLTNVSCRLDMKAGETVILGTSLIAGSTPVLARAVGPGLEQLGLALATLLADPHLRVFAGDTQIALNDDWELATRAYFGPTGAFDLSNGSKDAAVRVTFTPGGLTIHATGKGGGGVALIELYESQ